MKLDTRPVIDQLTAPNTYDVEDSMANLEGVVEDTCSTLDDGELSDVANRLWNATNGALDAVGRYLREMS